MPRTAKTPASRADDVIGAQLALTTLVPVAMRETAAHGFDSPQSRAAWAEVENAGAAVHRQARILAGKSRGG
jgi:hypothetical protein